MAEKLTRYICKLTRNALYLYIKALFFDNISGLFILFNALYFLINGLFKF